MLGARQAAGLEREGRGAGAEIFCALGEVPHHVLPEGKGIPIRFEFELECEGPMLSRAGEKKEVGRASGSGSAPAW